MSEETKGGQKVLKKRDRLDELVEKLTYSEAKTESSTEDLFAALALFFAAFGGGILCYKIATSKKGSASWGPGKITWEC